MSLTLASGEEAQIEKVEMRLERTAVYNFSVANNHTYTVGNVQFLVHNCQGRSGIYEVKSNGVETYVGKGGEKRAKISLKNHTGNEVFHYDISKGVAGFNVEQTAYIFEALHMENVAKQLQKTGKQLENKINSPGAKYINELRKSTNPSDKAKLQQLTSEYSKLVQQGGKKL